MFEWLDNTIQAGYTTGSLESVRDRLEQVRVTEPQTEYEKYLRHLVENPCCLLPRKPPPGLSGEALNKWGQESSFIADIVALFSNQHKHGMGCDWAKGEICRARFPRVIRPQHEIEDETGFLFMKQTEENINHYSPIMSLLLMCNHDVSPLRSGWMAQRGGSTRSRAAAIWASGPIPCRRYNSCSVPYFPAHRYFRLSPSTLVSWYS